MQTLYYVASQEVTQSGQKIIIDCTEIKIQMSSSLILTSQTYSSYKSANTIKCLIGIAPHGAVTFVHLYILVLCLMLISPGYVGYLICLRNVMF